MSVVCYTSADIWLQSLNYMGFVDHLLMPGSVTTDREAHSVLVSSQPLWVGLGVVLLAPLLGFT